MSAQPPPTTADLLRAGWQLIADPALWLSGPYERMLPDGRCARCSMAAVEEASALLGLDCAADQELAAEDCLDRAALALAGCKDYTLVNDRESQSHDTMRAIWALAIELADAEVTPC